MEYETVDSGYRPHELATVETSVEQVIESPEVSDEIDVIPDEKYHMTSKITLKLPLWNHCYLSFLLLFCFFTSF